MILTQTVNKNNKNALIFLIILTILVCVTYGQVDKDHISISCVLEDVITPECILNINKNSLTLIQQQPDYSTFLCPIFVKFYEQNQNYRSQLYENTEKVCRLSVEANIDNGYLLLDLYSMKQQYIRMLQLQYRLFFRQPFGHQKKFSKILTKYSNPQNQTLPTQQNPNLTQIQKFNLAIKLFYQNKITQSLKLISQNIKLQQKQLNKHKIFLTTRVLQKNGQFPLALQLLQKNITQLGSDAHWYLYHMKGNLLMHHLQFREAIRAFQQAVNIKTSHLGEKQFQFSLYNIGVCYQKLGNYQKSIQYFKLIIDREEIAEALNSLAFSYYSLINLQDAKMKKKNQELVRQAQKMYKRAIKADPNYYLAYYNYATLMYDTGNYQAAKQLYQRSISQNNIASSNLSSKYGLFKSQYKLNKSTGLLYLQNQILTIKDVPSVLSDVGSLLHQLGQNLLAKKYLQKAIQTKYNLGQVYQQKGVIQFQLNMNQQAIASFLKALQHGNIKSSVWFNLAYLYQLNGNYQKALGLYKKSLQKDPKSPAKQQIQHLTAKLKNKNNSQL